MRTKVASFFIFFQELSNKKKIKALRPKMTKIASRGGGGGPALIHWLLTKAVISFLAIEKVGFSYVYLTLSFLAMDVCASVNSPASLQSFFRSSVLTPAIQQVAITSFLGSTPSAFAALRWTFACVSPGKRLSCERTSLEVLFRCRRCKWWRSRLSSALSCTSSS